MMHDARTLQGEMSLQSIQEQLSKIGAIYPTIPRSVAFVDASQEHVPFKSRMDKAIAKIKKSKIWDDPKKKRQLEKLLAQLEALGESEEP